MIDNWLLLGGGCLLFAGTCFLPLLASKLSRLGAAHCKAVDATLTIVALWMCVTAFHSFVEGIVTVGLFYALGSIAFGTIHPEPLYPQLKKGKKNSGGGEYDHRNESRYSLSDCEAGVGRRAKLSLTGRIVGSGSSPAGAYVTFQPDGRWGIEERFSMDLDAFQLSSSTKTRLAP